MSTLSQFFSNASSSITPGNVLRVFRDTDTFTPPTGIKYIAVGVLGAGQEWDSAAGKAGNGGNFAWWDGEYTDTSNVSVVVGASAVAASHSSAALAGGRTITSHNGTWALIYNLGGEGGTDLEFHAGGGGGGAGGLFGPGGKGGDGKLANIVSPSALACKTAGGGGGFGSGGGGGSSVYFPDTGVTLDVSFDHLKGALGKGGGGGLDATWNRGGKGLGGMGALQGHLQDTLVSQADTGGSRQPGQTGYLPHYTTSGRFSFAKTFFGACGGGGGASSYGYRPHENALYDWGQVSQLPAGEGGGGAGYSVVKTITSTVVTSFPSPAGFGGGAGGSPKGYLLSDIYGAGLGGGGAGSVARGSAPSPEAAGDGVVAIECWTE